MSKRIVVLASGRGSNFESLAEACHDKKINGTIEKLFSNNSTALALTKASKFGISTDIITSKSLLTKLIELNPDLIVLAGYMKILRSDICEKFIGKIINIHPSLLPAFPGLHAQKQAFDARVKESGATVHFVDATLDGGPIIRQTKVLVSEDDTEETLTKKILEVEHPLLIECVKLFCEDKLILNGRKVIIST